MEEEDPNPNIKPIPHTVYYVAWLLVEGPLIANFLIKESSMFPFNPSIAQFVVNVIAGNRGITGQMQYLPNSLWSFLMSGSSFASTDVNLMQWTINSLPS
ncbi:hypothetical protein P3S67_025138 [Capsicum chacoense]